LHFLGWSIVSLDAVKAFSGETTMANVLIGLVADLKINQWLGYLVGRRLDIWRDTYAAVETNQKGTCRLFYFALKTAVGKQPVNPLEKETIKESICQPTARMMNNTQFAYAAAQVYAV
jgi:hypothetical protein